MLSRDDVRSALARFDCIKIDPRTDPQHEAFRFKQTRFVPEAVVLTPDHTLRASFGADQLFAQDFAVRLGQLAPKP